MRKFTVTRINMTQPDLVVVADYMTRDNHYPNTLKFWVRRKWWQFDTLVGTFEAKAYTQCTSEELGDDTSFLAEIGVKR